MLSLFDHIQQLITRLTTANEQTLVYIDATPSEHVIIDLRHVLALLDKGGDFREYRHSTELDSGEHFEVHRHLVDEMPIIQGPSLIRQILDDFKYAGCRGPHPSDQVKSRATSYRHP